MLDKRPQPFEVGLPTGPIMRGPHLAVLPSRLQSSREPLQVDDNS